MIFIILYLIVAFGFLFAASFNAHEVRESIELYPGHGTYGSEVDAKEKADSALLVLLTPVWPGILLFFAARGIWSLVKDVRNYYFKSNRKEGDDR